VTTPPILERAQMLIAASADRGSSAEERDTCILRRGRVERSSWADIYVQRLVGAAGLDDWKWTSS
jgi:hypothetical protein